MTYRKSFLLTAESPLIAALDQACEQLQEDTTKGQYLMATKPPVKPVTNGISDGAAGSYSSSYFLRKEVERLKKELKQEREGSNIPELTRKECCPWVNLPHHVWVFMWEGEHVKNSCTHYCLHYTEDETSECEYNIKMKNMHIIHMYQDCMCECIRMCATMA